MSNPICTADFDWTNDESIVCREQLAIAIYSNNNHGIVLRQERAWDEDADVYITMRPEFARAVAEAILRAAGLDANHLPQAEIFPPKDPTAADRQRRYRQRRRDHHGDDDIKSGDAVTLDGEGTTVRAVTRDAADTPLPQLLQLAGASTLEDR